MLENGLDVCTCKRVRCERHGKCAKCIEHHNMKKSPPYCKRSRGTNLLKVSSRVQNEAIMTDIIPKCPNYVSLS